MYFNFQNMAALCDNNAEKSKFRFSRSPCGDARYLVMDRYLLAFGLTLMIAHPYLRIGAER